MKKLLSCTCILALLASLNVNSWAGGFTLYQTGAPDSGAASAGRGALAQDASTAFTNPAGMAKLDGDNQLMVAAGFIVANVQFNPGPNTTKWATGGNDNGGQSGGTLPFGSLFYERKVSDKVNLGISGESYVGGSVSYNPDWVGRYYSTQSTLFTYSVNPVGSYKVNDQWSVGAGMQFVSGYLDNTVQINDLSFGADHQATAQVKSTAMGYGGNGGILWTPFEGTRIGATYKSQVKLPFNDVFHVTGLGAIGNILQNRLAGTTFNANLYVPQMAYLDGAQKVTDRLTLLGTAGWENWHKFGDVAVTANFPAGGTPTGTAHIDYKDTWHGALGTMYKLSEKNTGQLGISYDTSAVGQSERTPGLPMDSAWTYAFGFMHKLAENITLSENLALINQASSPIYQTPAIPDPNGRGTLDGSYNIWVTVLSLSLNVKF